MPHPPANDPAPPTPRPPRPAPAGAGGGPVGRASPAWIHYAAALLVIAVATSARLLLDPVVGDNYPFATYFVAVAPVALWSRTGPAVAALLACGLLTDFLFVPPRGSLFVGDPPAQVGMGLFWTVGVALVAMSHAMRRARTRADGLLADGAAREAELVRTRTQLDEQREWLRATLGSIGDAVVAADRSGRVTLLNRAAADLTGWAEAEAVGRPLADVFPAPLPSPPDESRQRGPGQESPDGSRQRRRGRGQADGAGVVRGRDGAERPVEYTAAPIRGGRGSVVVFRDVARQRLTEDELRASEERLRVAVAAAKLGQWSVDLRTREMVCSDGCRANYGRAPGESFTYADLWDTVHPADRDRARDAVRAAVETGADYDTEYRTVWPDGTLHWVIVRGRVNYAPDGTPLLVTGVTLDITDRKRSEERLRFLDALGEATRPASDPAAVMAAAARLLGEHLAVTRCAYADVEPDNDRFTIRDDWRVGGAATTAGTYRLDLFGTRAAADLRAGRTLVVRDVPAELAPADGADTFAAIGVRAIVCCPLVKDGRLRAMMAVHHAAARDWTPDEVDLVRDAAERSWAHIERVRAAASLRASEERFRTLFESMDEGFCVIEVLFGPAGAAVDYRFLETNPAFERHSGLAGVVGRTMREVVPGHDEHWFETYGRVATTGEPVRFESRGEALARWWDVYAFRVGGPGSPRVAVLFNDITARRQAEAAVRASEERLRAALVAARMVAWEWTPSDGRLRVSENAADVFGLPAGVGLTGIDQGLALLHPDDAAGYRATFERAIDDRGGYLTQYRLVRPDDGRVVWVEEQGHTVFDQPGGGARLYGVAADVTGRREADERLRASEARHSFAVALADAVRPLADPAAVQAEAGRVLGERLRADRVAYFEVRGDDYVIEYDYAAGVPSVVGRYPVASFGPDLLAEYRAGRTAHEADVAAHPDRPAAEKAAFAAIQIRAYVGVPLVKNGRLVAGLSVHSASPRDWTPAEIRTAEDAAERTWAAVERVRAEAAVRASEERFRTLFDTMSEGFCVVEVEFEPAGARAVDYRVEQANPAFEKHTGMAGLVGRSVRRAIPALEEFWFETYGRVAATGEPARFVHEARPMAGRSFDVSAFRVGGPGSRRVAVLFNDITDRRRAEDERERLVGELREQDRKKDEFLATLAHELRNPLAPIRTGLQVLKVAGDDRAAAERTRATMERQLAQMVRLVDDLLDLSRVSRGTLDLRRERADLAAVVADAVEATRPTIERMGHALAVELPPDPVALDADPTRLAQVLANLLTNSAKYTERGGRIRLRAERRDGDAVVSVADTGVGIPAGMLPRVFEMFTQVDTSIERSQGGLGIGLTLVKRLVEMHGGSVEARSDGPGRGSEFVVRLPALPAGAAAPATPVRPRPASPVRLRVLVADDNRDGADSLALMLNLLGSEATTAYDGEAAVAAAQAARPDAVLLDIGMPKLNGRDACRRIRAEAWGRGAVVVALSGWGRDEDVRLSREAGFDRHLVKPVDPAALVVLLGELLRAKA